MTDVFAALCRCLAPGFERPCLAPDIELARFESRWRGSHAVIHNPRSDSYVRLSGADAEIVASLDGTRSVADLAVGGLADRGLRPDVLADLVSFLHRGGFLTTPWIDTYQLLEERTSSRSSVSGARASPRTRTMSIRFCGAHRFVDSLYNAGARRLFTPVAQIALMMVLVSGAVTFLVQSSRGRFTLLGHPTVAAAVALVILQLVGVFVHELGHALAIRHAGRRILSAGFELYLASPAFFIDSSDMVMTGRKQRAVNAIAGPYAGCVVAGAAALGAALAGPSPMGEVLFRLAGVTFVFNLLNLVPFLELDGYWLLTDLIDMPDLRPRALSFLRHDLIHHIRSRQRLTRGEWLLVLFGVLGVVFTIAALVLAWVLWSPVISAFATGLWHTGLVGRTMLVLLAALVLAPFAHSIGDAVRAVRGWIGACLESLRFRAERRWRVEAGEMISALPHTAELTADDLNDVAGRVDRRLFRAGEALVRQGDAADAFYLIRRGRCCVVEKTMEGGETVIAHLGSGSTFGELALLEGTPRSATVRAESTGEAFVVDAGTFQRILAGALAGSSLAPPDWPLTRVWQLAPFRDLDLNAVAELAAGGTWQRAAPGDEIVRHGEIGDAFYVVDSGQLEARRDGVFLASLGAGDFFGEIALLDDVPRTATVQAVTPARLFVLPRPVFDRVLRAAFTRGHLVPGAVALSRSTGASVPQ